MNVDRSFSKSVICINVFFNRIGVLKCLLQASALSRCINTNDRHRDRYRHRHVRGSQFTGSR
jgi:hypothetical protein